MRYAFEDHVSENGFYWSWLLEMTDAELASASASASADTRFSRCTWEAAHKWVLSGGDHRTALYVDDTGRVRRAEPMS